MADQANASQQAEVTGPPTDRRTGFEKGVALAGGAVVAAVALDLLVRPSPAYGEPRPDIPRPTCVAKVSEASAVTCEDGRTVVLWENINPPNDPPDDVRRTKFTKDHEKKVAYVAVAARANQVFSASFDGVVSVRDVARPNRDPLHELRHFANTVPPERRPEVWVVAPTPDGKWALAGENTGKILLWDVQNEAVKATFEAGAERVAAITFRPPVPDVPGRIQFLAGYEDGRVLVWEFDTRDDPIRGRIVRPFLHDNRDEPVNTVAVSPNGRVAVSAGFERVARVWNVTNAAPIATVDDFEDLIWRVAISPDGKKFATASQDGTVRLFRLSNGDEFPETAGFDRRRTEPWGAMGVDFLSNTRIIYTTADSGRQHFKTWDIPADWPPGPPPP